MSEFSEDSRVKFPALIHLVGMGFEYISSNNSAKPQEQQEPYDPLTNILVDKFKEAFLNLNPGLNEEDAEKKLADIQTSVGYNDLGRHFYNEILMEPGQGRIVDFTSEKAFKENNTFQVTTEMTCGSKKDDNFRPDITIFINGLPLAFIEVKPDNNHEGIQAEGEEPLPVIKIREMHDGFSPDSEYVSPNIPEAVRVYNGDILFSWSASLEVMQWCFGNGGLNQHIFKVTAANSFPKSFYYYQLLDYVSVFKKMAEARKTTMGHITQDHLQQSTIAIPDDVAIANKLDDVIKPIFDKIVKLQEEITELTKQRDELLPLLMNGQVTIV